mmetsp:Transcript_1094/g.1693  ORF Transcript_1094/g.1693 Transcript_1094/m.1693 type:complete len:201 (+) Transcript_1094:37-639(+)
MQNPLQSLAFLDDEPLVEHQQDEMKDRALDASNQNDVVRFVIINRKNREKSETGIVNDYMVQSLMDNMNVNKKLATQLVEEYRISINVDPYSSSPMTFALPKTCRETKPISKLAARKLNNGEVLYRVCSKCHKKKPSTDYSNTSWRRAEGQCKKCVDKRVTSTNNHQKTKRSPRRSPHRRSPRKYHYHNDDVNRIELHDR